MSESKTLRIDRTYRAPAQAVFDSLERMLALAGDSG